MGGDWGWDCSEQYPVARNTPGFVNVALIHWATTAFISELLPVLVCSVSPNCFRGGGRWKGSRLFYIYLRAGGDRQRWLFCGWSVQGGDGFSQPKMPLSPLGFCFVPGRDRENASTPTHPQLPPHSPVLLLMRSCPAGANPPLLLCK